jgi:hypothetical protein
MAGNGFRDRGRRIQIVQYIFRLPLFSTRAAQAATLSFLFRPCKVVVCMEPFGLHKCKTSPVGRGLQIYRSRKEDQIMILLVLILVLVLRRTRRTKLKIEIDL